MYTQSRVYGLDRILENARFEKKKTLPLGQIYYNDEHRILNANAICVHAFNTTHLFPSQSLKTFITTF